MDMDLFCSYLKYFLYYVLSKVKLEQKVETCTAPTFLTYHSPCSGLTKDKVSKNTYISQVGKKRHELRVTKWTKIEMVVCFVHLFHILFSFSLVLLEKKNQSIWSQREFLASQGLHFPTSRFPHFLLLPLPVPTDIACLSQAFLSSTRCMISTPL